MRGQRSGRTFTRALASALVAVALVAGGCGSNDSFKSDFQKSDDQLNQLGKDLALAVRTAGKSNDTALSAKFDSFSTRARKLASDFGGLKPPSKVKANVTKLRSALTLIADDMKAVATAVRTHNAKAARSATRKLFVDAGGVRTSASAIRDAEGIKRSPGSG